MTATEIIFCILGLLCIIHGVIIWNLHTGTLNFVLWFGLGGFCVCLAAVFYWHLWSKLPVGLQWLFGIGFGLLVTSFILVEGVIVSGFFYETPENLDYLVVLGAQVGENGPSRVLRFRLDEAKCYLDTHPEAKCIVSGGQGYNEPMSEAQCMYEYLAGQGIAPERIRVEDASTTTLENIRNSSHFFDPEKDKIGIVTNNFHVFRSVHLAKKMGVRNAYGVVAETSPFYLPNNMLREYFGVCKDFLQGNL